MAASFMLEMGGRDTSNGGVFARDDVFSPPFFVNVEVSVRALWTLQTRTLHVTVTFVRYTHLKGLIFSASVCVNKMAFLERGCGEPHSVGAWSSGVEDGWKS